MNNLGLNTFVLGKPEDIDKLPKDLLKKMTKAELVHKVKILETINSDLDIALDDALEEIKDLKGELSLARTIIRKTFEGEEGALSIDDLKDIQFTEDGELSKDGLKMLIRAGMDHEDIQELIDKGDEIVEWLEKKGIKLDAGGSLDKN